MPIIHGKPTHKEHLSQPLQTRNIQYKIAVTFLSDYIRSFNVTDKTIAFLQGHLTMMILILIPLPGEPTNLRA